MNTAVARIEDRIDREVSKAIAIGNAGITFENAGQVMEYAKMMAVSGPAVPKHLRGNPGACLGIIDDAIRFQMSAYPLARKSYFVNDNLAYEAQVLAAIVIARSPLKQRPDVTFSGEGADRVCTVTGEFLDGAVRTVDSPMIKNINPKNSPLWKSDPDQQQAYYTLRAFARRHCPDVILGMYDPEELAALQARDVTEQSRFADRIKKQADADAAERQDTQEGFSRDHVHDSANGVVDASVDETDELPLETQDQPDLSSQAPVEGADDPSASGESDATDIPHSQSPQTALASLSDDQRKTLLEFATAHYGAIDKDGREQAREDFVERIKQMGESGLTVAKFIRSNVDAREPEKVAELFAMDVEDLKARVS